MTQRRRYVVRALLAAALASGSALPLLAAPASAALPGYVRLAHLSPDTPRVNVSVTSFRGRDYSKTFEGVGYGALSPYERMAAGTYTVAVRSLDAGSRQPPLIRATLIVAAGKAYTLAGVGRKAHLALRIIPDEFEQPRPGKAALRVMHASSSAPVVDVRATAGGWIAQDVRYPSTTPYSEISAHTLTLRAEPKGAGLRPGEQTVEVKAGTNYTALVLDRGKSAVRIVVRKDAAGSAAAPVGAVDAGFGGGAGHRGHPLPPEVWFGGLGFVFLTAAVVWSRRCARG